jgi:hypothetical protein
MSEVRALAFLGGPASPSLDDEFGVDDDGRPVTYEGHLIRSGVGTMPLSPP